MKIIVVCGRHPTEGGATRLCLELKKDNYKELNRLGGRKFTEEEIKFLNVSSYNNLHTFARRFAKLSLNDILGIYEAHIKKGNLPDKIKAYLRNYLEFWKEHSNNYEHALPSFMAGQSLTENKDIVSLRQYLLPPKLNWLYMATPLVYDTPEGIASIPSVNAELRKCPTAIIINMHCTHNNAYNDIKNHPLREWARYYKPWRSFSGRFDGLAIIDDNKRHIIIPETPKIRQQEQEEDAEIDFISAVSGVPFIVTKDNVLKETPPSFKFEPGLGYLCIELYLGLLLKKMTWVYEGDCTSKQSAFFYYLNNELAPHLFTSYLKEVERAATFTNKKLYNTEQFENLKETTARLIRNLVEWGKKYDG